MAEDILSFNVKLKSHSEALKILSKYYYKLGYSRLQIENMLEEYLLKADKDIIIPLWEDTIEKYAKTADKHELVDIDFVPITENELNKISALKNKPLERLAFTLLCIAKFYNIINPNNNNWVNKDDKYIFKIANIQKTCFQQSLMYNDLYRMDYIGYSKIIDNLNINVKYIDDNSPISLKISDYRNLGYQYMRYRGEHFLECENCGILIKKKSNRQKYCKKCAVKMNRENTAKRWNIQYKIDHF